MGQYCEYVINLDRYQLQEVSTRVFGYRPYYRKSLYTYIANNYPKKLLPYKEYLQKIKHDKGFIGLFQKKIKSTTKGWCYMSPRGKIKYYGTSQYHGRKRRFDRDKVLLDLWILCLNEGFGRNLNSVSIRVDADDYHTHKLVEDLLRRIGCKVQIKYS